MNVSLSTGSAGTSALQALASMTRTRTSQAGDFSVSNDTPCIQGPPPGPPPGSSLDISMSTAQFAQSTQGRGDPLMALDSNGDGAVSSSEFGIGDNSDGKVKALFDAIDTNGDGSLSSTESDAFRQQMMQALDSESRGSHPPGPPPGGGGSAQDFVQQLAQLYASLQSDASASTGASGGTVSLQA